MSESLSVSDSGSLRPAEWVTLGLVSALAIGLQIILIRVFSIVSHHHFVYLVVSTALLGFGASGTLVALLGDRNDLWYRSITLAALLGLSATAWLLRLALVIPIDLYYLLYSLREAGRLWLTTLVVFVPFFMAGLFVGSLLRRARAHPGSAYAANLIGSGCGGISFVPLLGLLSPERAAAGVGVIAAGAAVFWALAMPPGHSRAARLAALATACIAGLGVSIAGITVPWQLPIDQYKGLAFARDLEAQGDAEAIARARSPVSHVEIYNAPSMHYTLFASPGAPAPPAQLQVFRDGFLAGGLFGIDRSDEASILDWLPQALPYAILDRPNVLILGETTGVDVWLALHLGARSVTVVHEDRALVGLLQGSLRDRGGQVFTDERVQLITSDPRTALMRLADTFDLIHLADAETLPAASAGLVSLQEDYLLTTQAIEAALAHLEPGGLITVTRGLQSPPRDNLRLFALFAEAIDVTNGGAVPTDGADQAVTGRLFQARNYLAATTILSRDLLPRDSIMQLVQSAHTLRMDVDYFPGITEADLTQINVVDGPDSSTGSYFYAGAVAIAEGSGPEFARQWDYRIDPPTDNNPYFHNFLRLRSLPDHIATYGTFWFSRLELGPVVVLVTLFGAVIAGVILILVPVLIERGRRRPMRRRTGWVVLHFLLIGLGFMAIEMLLVQKTGLVLGDPVYSAAAVITAMLIWAGTGSSVQSRLRLPPDRRILAGAGLVIVLAVPTVFGIDFLSSTIARATQLLRFVSIVLLLAPLSFVMGWLFPAGIARAHERASEIGLALAVNGVASVVAAPLAVLVAASFGFVVLLAGSLCCYAIVGAAALLPRPLDDGQALRRSP